MTHGRRLPLLICLLSSAAFAAEPDLTGYKPLSQAITAEVDTRGTGTRGLTGYLGVSLEAKLKISEVEPGSPAEAAGLCTGDEITSIDGKNIRLIEQARALLQSKPPGQSISIAVKRGDESLSLTATLAATSRPMRVNARAIMGVKMGEPREEGIPVASVTKDRPAAKAGIRQGDLILSVDDTAIGEGRLMNDALSEKKPGETVKLRLRRKEEELEKSIKLISDPLSSSVPLEERRELTTWKKDTFRIAVVTIEFPDVKHDERISLNNWDNAFFSHGIYHGTNALKQAVYGSMNDYYQEASCGKLSIKGKVFPWLMMKEKHTAYDQLRSRGEGKTGLLHEALDALIEREGPKALEGFDGIGFIYAGAKDPGVGRGGIFWPHRSTLFHEKVRFSYVIVPELTAKKEMSNISTMCHETGHSLGLPDLYARPENPGSEGAGAWCIMSNQSPNGRPQHFCAWSKEQLGWLNPVVIDPTVKQKLILGPVEGSSTECLKVLVRRDGTEYFLLENRRKTGFDTSLPAQGLLIWRVVDNRPVLEESHGVTGPSGPRVFLPSVPFPSRSNNSFTPYTTPSSRSQLGGGLPVYISGIRQLQDGRITLEIGYVFE